MDSAAASTPKTLSAWPLIRKQVRGRERTRDDARQRLTRLRRSTWRLEGELAFAAFAS